jgi:hypothetical protein
MCRREVRGSLTLHRWYADRRACAPRKKVPPTRLGHRSTMYGLKKEIDLNFLNGRELIQVAIGLYRISFRFDEDVAISVEGEFTYFDGQAEWTWKSEAGAMQIASRTVSLLGATILSFEGHENGTLSLVFSNGQRLTILDSSKEYQSYDITWPGVTIVV